MDQAAVVDWLLAGDVAVQFQTTRDLLHRDAVPLRARIAREGHGAALLAARRPDGHWGRSFYQPKWTSSHYTLLELRNLGLDPRHPAAVETVAMILRDERHRDGGLDPTRGERGSDVCVNGMALDYATYFGGAASGLVSLVDFLLAHRMVDGGFNCRDLRAGTSHSSVHTTLSVIEGITGYERNGYEHRLDELLEARAAAVEFLMRHRLYRSERTGTIMRSDFVRLHHPARWYFDVLRCLDAFVAAGVPDDDRLSDALAVLYARREPDGRWPVSRAYPGQTHVPPPPAGSPNRWVTLIALRVLAAYPR
jgi:hypothetical protein